MSADDAGERVHGQIESRLHVPAQSAVLLLRQLEFALHTFLDVVGGIEAGGDLHAAARETRWWRRQTCKLPLVIIGTQTLLIFLKNHHKINYINVYI